MGHISSHEEQVHAQPRVSSSRSSSIEPQQHLSHKVPYKEGRRAFRRGAARNAGVQLKHFRMSRPSR
jgi:hypothetical protein